MTARQIHGLPVVTMRSGEDVAEVRDVIYDPDAGALVGLTLNKRGYFSGRHPSVLPVGSIHAIGKDAVMIEDPSSLTAPQDAPQEVAAPPPGRDVLGDEVLTEGGARLGVVHDLVLLVGTRGEVVGYEIERPDGGHAYVPLSAQLAVSGDALVVPDAVDQFLREDLEAFGETLEGHGPPEGAP